MISTTFSKKRLNVPSVDNESCPSINMLKLLSAIQKMKRKGAAGPDNIPPTFLKSLGPLALQELLSIFNASFHLADCPRIWRVAFIIPLLKAGKSPSDVASFRPISLTSCVVKLLERIIVYRLHYIAESNNLFSRFPAGFRKGRSCEDYVLRIVKTIEDDFNTDLCSALFWHYWTSVFLFFFFYSLFKVDITNTVVILLIYNILLQIDWFDVISSWRYHQNNQ